MYPRFPAVCLTSSFKIEPIIRFLTSSSEHYRDLVFPTLTQTFYKHQICSYQLHLQARQIQNWELLAIYSEGVPAPRGGVIVALPIVRLTLDIGEQESGFMTSISDTLFNASARNANLV